MSPFLLELIKSIILIVVAIITIFVSVGILRLNNDMNNVVYARIHLLGVIDMMAVITFIVLDYPLLGVLYFLLTPFAAHAIAHSFYYNEDTENSKEEDSDLNNEIVDEGEK